MQGNEKRNGIWNSLVILPVIHKLGGRFFVIHTCIKAISTFLLKLNFQKKKRECIFLERKQLGTENMTLGMHIFCKNCQISSFPFLAVIAKFTFCNK